jgi:hypothetical protein
VKAFEPTAFDSGRFEAGSDYSLDVDTGSYALTGYSAAIDYGRSVDAQQGAYTITGYDATFFEFFVFGAGLYQVTGFAADFLAARSVIADQGTYEVTGYSAELFHDYYFPIEFGNYEVTGNNARLFKSAYFFDDTEIIVVPWEKKSVILDTENRLLVVQAAEPDVEELEEDRQMTVANRMRQRP